MSKSIIGVVLGCALAMASLEGCGATSKTTPRTASARTSATTPRYSGLKRRYLARFKTNCALAASGANSSAKLIQQLIERIGRGEAKALPELVVYLNRLADAFEGSLRQAARYGAPPNPDGRYGRDYFKDSRQAIGAIRALSKAVVHLDARGIGSAVKLLSGATNAAQRDGKRYGMPMCSTGHSSPPLPQSGQAI